MPFWIEAAGLMRHSMSAYGCARCRVACALGAVGLILSGCASETVDERLQVVVTIAPLAGLVDRVAPDISAVTVMIPPGGNPVFYEPSLSRVLAASSADLFVSVGHPAFAWENTWLADLLRQGDAPVVSSAESCDILPDDPHVWLSLPCARSIALRIASAVQQARPEAAESVGASLRDLLAEMDDLRLHADRSLEPHRGGSFIVLHPAWGYLARDYDLQQISILEHGSGDAGPGELAAIVRHGRERGLVDVMVQPQFSAQPARLVADELGGNTVVLDPLARDWATTFRETVRVLSVQVRP